MKRDRLIPVEKSKKVIYLDPRGRGVDQKHYGAMALYVLAVLCALYCVGIGLFVGFGSYFFLIWGVIAAFCAAWGWILTHKSVQERIPRWIRMTFCGLVAAGILLLLILEGMIFGQFGAKAEAGYNEPVSEAEGMKGYLADAGIDPERILAEDASTNTTQNLIYSGELLNKSEDSVVVVTNNFHMFRALAIAKKQGYLHVEGLSAGTFPLTVPNNLLREAFGIVKDFMANNL